MGTGQRPYEADGGEGGDAGRHPARGFEAWSRREVEGEGAAVRMEGLAERATPLGLRSIRMQRIRERTCEVGLSAPGARRRTQNRRERHARVLLGAVLPSSGISSGAFWSPPVNREGYTMHVHRDNCSLPANFAVTAF